jgi:hypothetical protein
MIYFASSWKEIGRSTQFTIRDQLEIYRFWALKVNLKV